jgi:ElaB/YqjD/DUF883 family membrane-anchored ribosome-binding protein
MESDTASKAGNGDANRSALSRGVDQAAATAHGALTTVADTARPAVDRMAASAHEAVDRVAGVAIQAADSLGVKGDQLKTAQSKFVAGTRDYVREHPAAALGIAVAAGYMLSRLLSSR